MFAIVCILILLWVAGFRINKAVNALIGLVILGYCLSFIIQGLGLASWMLPVAAIGLFAIPAAACSLSGGGRGEEENEGCEGSK